jgi:hypothetical protein
MSAELEPGGAPSDAGRSRRRWITALSAPSYTPIVMALIALFEKVLGTRSGDVPGWATPIYVVTMFVSMWSCLLGPILLTIAAVLLVKEYRASTGRRALAKVVAIFSGAVLTWLIGFCWVATHINK